MMHRKPLTLLSSLAMTALWCFGVGPCGGLSTFCSAQESGIAEVQTEEDVAEADQDTVGHSDPQHDDKSGDGSHADGAHADAEHGDGHTDNDPTHANVSDPTWEVVDFRTDMAFFSAIVFLLLLFGLSTTAWKPIMQGLEKREQSIADKIANAERASQDAEAKLSEYESKLATANEEAQQIVAEARKDAEATGQKLIAAAQEEAARAKDRSLADIESAKRVALNDLANQSSEVAMSLAKRVVGREVNAEDHQSMIQEMLSKLPSNN